MKRLLIAASLAAMLSAAQAAKVPQPGVLDFRVRTENFTDGQVYKIKGFFGYHALVLFAPDEQITKVGGFNEGWKIDELGNKVLISPKVEDADSNLTVITDRHVYYFDLSVKPFPKGKYQSQAEDVEQTYGLRFRYPDDEAKAAATKAAEARAAQRMRDAAKATDSLPKNYNYTYMGSEAIKPYAAWDDGTFTYFKFYAQQDLPTVFVINDDGTESAVNKGMERDGDTLVIQRVGKQFVLRMGNSVTCIYNEGSQALTPSTGNETSTPDVRRVIKGEKQ